MIINSQQESFQGIGNKNYKPLIKWAGGKSRLNKQLLKVADLALNSLFTSKKISEIIDIVEISINITISENKVISINFIFSKNTKLIKGKKRYFKEFIIC